MLFMHRGHKFQGHGNFVVTTRMDTTVIVGRGKVMLSYTDVSHYDCTQG